MNPKRRYRLLVAVIEAVGDRENEKDKRRKIPSREWTGRPLPPFYFLYPKKSLYIIASTIST